MTNENCTDDKDDSPVGHEAQTTKDIQPMLAQSWATVFDAGPT